MTTEAPIATTVGRRRVIADGVIELTLRPESGEVTKWQPGAHIDLLLGNGLVRQYSLCGDTGEAYATGELTVAVLREVDGRGGSAWIHDNVHEGDRVEIRGPRNNFTLLDAERYLFIAGGIGITPLVPMIRTVARSGAEWRLVYGGRTSASMAYADELRELGGDVVLVPQDEQGLPDLDAELGTPRTDTLVYCCGPEPLLQAVEQRCLGSWPPSTLQVERFTPIAADPNAINTTFEVECSLSGLVVEVASDISILHALEAAGLDLLSSCQEGTCGTCETVIIEGEADHRDSVLTREEQATNEIMMICCSRARSARLVLEL